MKNLLDFIEKRKWGILVTFILHLGLLLYLQIDTYSYTLPVRSYELMAEVIEDEYIELSPEQIVIPEEQLMQNYSGDVKNITKSANDRREKSYDNFSRSSIDQKVEERVRDLEKQFFDEFASARTGSAESGSEVINKNASSGEQSSSSKSNDSNKSQKENTLSAGANSSDRQYAGRTMVRYDLKNRYPHNNNDWYIRNPGYTCGNNANGTVAVAIRVNQNGDVVSARYVPEMSENANACMIEQAEIYAKKSRFAFKGDAPKTQDGFIYYTFISKR
jgi:hypothetical protein